MALCAATTQCKASHSMHQAHTHPSRAITAAPMLATSPVPRCRRRSTLLRPVTATSPSSDNNLKAAQARWEKQVRDGRVSNISTSDIRPMMADGWTLLDVRPPNERAKAQLQGAIEVPLFVIADDITLTNFVKQAAAFGMGGWWLGGAHMRPNPSFLPDVQARVPRDAKLVVVCQKGLRSLAACEQLARAGYNTLAWVNGGLDMAQPGDLETKGGVDIRLAGIGGVTELLGWTEVQQELNGGFPGGIETLQKLVIVVLVLDAVWLGYTFLSPQGL